MSWDPEPCAEALFTLVRDIEPVRWATRKLLGVDSIPEQPAVMVILGGLNADSDHSRPIKWTAQFLVTLAARSDGSETSPESTINEWLVNLQEVMAGAGDLDGTCEHCLISGEIEVWPWTQDDPWMFCKVPVEVVAVG